MPLVLGYVDVWSGISTPTPKLQTFPLSVILAVPNGEAPPVDDDAFRKTNRLLVGMPPVEVQVGTMLTQNDAAGRRIEFILAPPAAFVDGEIVVRVNTMRLTQDVDFAARPSPKRGEAFVFFGTRFPGTTSAPVLRAVLGVAKGTQATEPLDVTTIKVSADFHEPRTLIVGQARPLPATAQI